MLEYSHGEIGWDVFTLEYKIDAPVDTIIDPKSMESYLKIFSWIVLAEMIHFVRELQAFCQLEVIECSWKELMDFIKKKEGDLDALIQAHQNYLERTVRKVLLISPKAGKEVSMFRKQRT